MYSDLIVQHFGDPQHVGDLDDNNIEFEIGNSVCGDRVRIQATLNDSNIESIVFRAWGCATSVATADIFCEYAKGSSLIDVQSRTKPEIAALLGDLEPSQQHCVNIMMELHQQLLIEASKEVVENEY